MRTFIIAIIVLAAVLAGITGYHLYCNKTTNNLWELAMSENVLTADGADQLYTYWKKHRFALHLGVDTSTITDVETQIISLCAAVNTGSDENTAEAVELLRYELSELRKLSSLSLENIF